MKRVPDILMINDSGIGMTLKSEDPMTRIGL